MPAVRRIRHPSGRAGGRREDLPSARSHRPACTASTSLGVGTIAVARLLLLALAAAGGNSAVAADGGTGVYLLGKRGPLAAFVPKPGWYLTDDVYYYGAGSSDYLPLGGRIAQKADVQALINIAQFTWVADTALLGGRLALSAVLPFGQVEVSAHGQVALESGSVVSAGKSDSATGMGDPALGASLGWKKRTGDRFRAWSVYSSVFVPVGDYAVGRIANVGKNRWALDLGGAYTMANFSGGRELSAVLGFTFNGDNQDTDYETGTEMHLEFAGKQHLPKHWSFGVVGYWYEQLTGDGNNPDLLGDFKGRVIALGPELSYQVTASKTHPLTLDLRWYHEFDVTNRMAGDAIFLTFSVPLSITAKPRAGQDWTQSETGNP
jgi:hypothetical protein